MNRLTRHLCCAGRRSPVALAWILLCLSATVFAQGRQGVAGDGLTAALRAALREARGRALESLPLTARAQLQAVYEQGGWAPLWVDAERHPHADSREALQLLAGAAREGLEPRDYEAAALSARAVALTRASLQAAADVAAFDVALSAGMVLYLRDLHIGRVDPKAIGFRMGTGGDEHNFPALLRVALRDRRLTAAATELEPQTAFYRGIRAALLRYRSLRDDTSTVPQPIGRVLRPGDAYDGLALLRSRLTMLGDWREGRADAPSSPGVYDGPWVEAVKRFQARHGLETDGVAGPETLGALRVPVSTRIRQLDMSLERLRWLPHVPRGPMITVNVPMFQLWAWDAMGSGGMPVLQSRVIVGRALDTETPVFAEEMSHVIFRPYWNVPSSIVRGEVLPAVARDPGYISRQHMEIVDGPGDNARPVELTAAAIQRLREGRVRLRQRPGPTNALGLVKFVFPNTDNVYLHGTPAARLFDRTRRDLSHGCVRVEEPVALAEWVLRGEQGWNRDRVVAAMNASRSTRVDLATPIPVVLFYTTALAMPNDDTVHFAKDIYGHDEKLDRALSRRGATR